MMNAEFDLVGSISYKEKQEEKSKECFLFKSKKKQGIYIKTKGPERTLLHIAIFTN